MTRAAGGSCRLDIRYRRRREARARVGRDGASPQIRQVWWLALCHFTEEGTIDSPPVAAWIDCDI